MSDELRRFERWYPGSVPFTTPSQAEKIFEQRMEREIERNKEKQKQEQKCQQLIVLCAHYSCKLPRTNLICFFTFGNNKGLVINQQQSVENAGGQKYLTIQLTNSFFQVVKHFQLTS